MKAAFLKKRSPWGMHYPRLANVQMTYVWTDAGNFASTQRKCATLNFNKKQPWVSRRYRRSYEQAIQNGAFECCCHRHGQTLKLPMEDKLLSTTDWLKKVNSCSLVVHSPYWVDVPSVHGVQKHLLIDLQDVSTRQESRQLLQDDVQHNDVDYHQQVLRTERVVQID